MTYKSHIQSMNTNGIGLVQSSYLYIVNAKDRQLMQYPDLYKSYYEQITIPLNSVVGKIKVRTNEYFRYANR